MSVRDWIFLLTPIVTALAVFVLRQTWKAEATELRAEWRTELAVVRTEASNLLALHNEHVYSHPNLEGVRRVETKIEALDAKMDTAIEKIGQLIPRRRETD